MKILAENTRGRTRPTYIYIEERQKLRYFSSYFYILWRSPFLPFVVILLTVSFNLAELRVKILVSRPRISGAPIHASDGYSNLVSAFARQWATRRPGDARANLLGDRARM